VKLVWNDKVDIPIYGVNCQFRMFSQKIHIITNHSMQKTLYVGLQLFFNPTDTAPNFARELHEQKR